MPYSVNASLERVLTAEEKASMEGELFVNRELVDVDFSGADLRGAVFEKTLLTRCNLAGADLRGARFILCDLHGVVLAAVRLDDARFDGTTLVEVVGLDPPTRVLIERCGGSFQQARASLR
jgi:BTB/POZ domain-containing protein KCTD9